MDDSSDDEYVAYSDTEYNDDSIARRTRKRDKRSAENPSLRGQTGGYAWEEDYQRSWDVLQEDAHGSLESVVASVVEDQKKKHILKDTRPLQRGIIRNVVLILDLSFAMLDRDLRPNRYQLMLSYAIEFVNEFFDQNPISQLAIVGMRDGLGVLISELDGNPSQHVFALQDLQKQEPKGEPSLQNALELCRGVLFHVPSHCTKEAVVVLGALLTSDPGDIHQTIASLVKDKIRCRVIGLAAQVAVCQELAAKTNFGDPSAYGVVLNEAHFKDLFIYCTTPLALSKMFATNAGTSLVLMGFPSRISEPAPTMCADHFELRKGGYLCPRCFTKTCSLPAMCPCCNLTLILSTHLSRSYHHLFPLQNFVEVEADKVQPSWNVPKECLACLASFSAAETRNRYVCPKCFNHFCIDCDVFCHATLHNCPGCESRRKGPQILLPTASR